MSPELPYQLALTEIQHIGYVQAKILTDHFGSASRIFNAARDKLERLEGIGPIRARSIKSFRDFSNVEKEIKFINRYGIRTLYLTDKEYPQRLLNCYDPPTLLYYKGVADLNASRLIAVAGTRNNSEYGKSMTEKIVKELASFNCTVVSGLAFGIDSIAHKSALKYNTPTIGVVGHGLDTIYPQQNAALAKQMLKEGGILTEFRSKTTPDKHNFPSRNRIVAGITDATIIVESGVKGGSMITADLANGYNRDVFSVPGRTTDIKSSGCNELIRNNKAVLLQEPAHFSEIMGWTDNKRLTPSFQKDLFLNLTADETKIVDLLKKSQHLTIDDLNFQSNVSSSSLSASLLNLEIMGAVKVLPGKRYSLTNQ